MLEVVAVGEEVGILDLGWVSLSAGSHVPCITKMFFTPPLPDDTRAELRIGRAIVALEDAFSVPQAMEPRSPPALHVASLAPDRIGKFLDNAAPDTPLHIRIVGNFAAAVHCRLVLEGLNVMDQERGETIYADGH
jgi:hypothetical protein